MARLLLANGFDDIRVIGGTGDEGADILGVFRNQLWVVQCKHTTTSLPSRSAVAEAASAASYYGATRIAVATSRPASEAMRDEVERFERNGVHVEVLEPRRLLAQMSSTPQYAKARKRLWPFQESASDRFRQGLIDTGRAQIVLATGLGKTVIMSETVADLLRDDLVKWGRVLVLAHTNPLVSQLQRHFWDQLPKWVPTHRLGDGEWPSFWEGVTFTSNSECVVSTSCSPGVRLGAGGRGAPCRRSDIQAGYR